MNLSNKNMWSYSPLCRAASILGTLGIGAMTFLSITEPASAISIAAGSDYLFTLSEGTVFQGISFEGAPIGPNAPKPAPGQTDTIIKRLNPLTSSNPNGDCLAVGPQCTTNIELVALSLVSVDPIELSPGQFFDVFATLSPGTASTGTMTINEDTFTFSSTLDVFFDLNAAPVGGGLLTPFQLGNMLTLEVSNAPWSPNPTPIQLIVGGDYPDSHANLHTGLPPGFTDFFPGLSQHDASGAAKHLVRPAVIPEPSTILGSVIAVGAAAALKKRRSSRNKALTS